MRGQVRQAGQQPLRLLIVVVAAAIAAKAAAAFAKRLQQIMLAAGVGAMRRLVLRHLRRERLRDC
jgi:hypothetical protein